jgi:glycine oxidase
MPATSDVVIVGGGVIGCGIAYELARRGMGVTVVDRGEIGGEASRASAGILSIPARPEVTRARVELHRRSLERYPGLLAELAERTGHDLEFSRPGDMTVAVGAEEAAARANIVAWQQAQGFDIAPLDPAEARRLEPALPPEVHSVWYTPIASSLSVHRLTRALAAAAESYGATILPGTPAGGLLRDGERATGVRLLDRDLGAGTVVLATGAWTRFLGQQVGADLPTFPVKGQIIAFGRTPTQPTHILSGHGGFVRPRPDGSTIVAATTEPEAGFDRRVTGAGLAWLLSLVRTLCPALLEGEVIDSWAGLRPGTATINPMLGPVPGVPGLWVAAGHHRTGAVEAPATMELIAAALAENEVEPLLAEFAPPA